MRNLLQNIVLHIEAGYDRPFGPAWNPLRQLGTLTFFLYWVVAGTGIYLYIFFDTTVAGVYQSIDSITFEQWWAGGIIRSLHRYASDAMVVMALLHLSREFIFDRYRDVRWFTWFTGVPILWFLMFCGISGYWLVWDVVAQYIAIDSMEWLDWLGIFGEPLANNFLAPGSLTDRFFTLLIFMHIFAPLILLIIMWFHVIRVSRPKINPPKGLAVGILVMLTILSLLYPAVSQPPANLNLAVSQVNLDWFYMLFYPIFDKIGAGPMWGAAIGISTLFLAMPWLPPMKKPSPAFVLLQDCNGCGRCYEDCPFGAVTMGTRTDGLHFEREAIVDPDLCTACGICVGACPVSTPFRHTDNLTTGIDLPDLSLDLLRENTYSAATRTIVSGPTHTKAPRILIFGCDHGADVHLVEGPGVAGISLPCIGMLPPSFIDFAISRLDIDGVLLTGCRECDCYNRLGNTWMDERIAGDRDPYLRSRVPRNRLRVCWAGRTDMQYLNDELEQFKTSLTSENEPT